MLLDLETPDLEMRPGGSRRGPAIVLTSRVLSREPEDTIGYVITNDGDRVTYHDEMES